ncbi:aminopeptidase M1-like [Tupanvirus soda lake]|uniref:Aminopeptidase M1-like n=2 Tax=Tupanvirus TaxID=2094720 RepID=A0A6N1NX62_9VIRU|nr:aminopeptidase M1-like [Tupanvirus soda lake]QKU34812.1 aminopeptidase M1-like [Tupanvirus soda lake]
MNKYRLPKDIRPIKYIIKIEPIGPDYDNFDGVCKIIYYGGGNRKNITLNSFDLEINDVHLMDNKKSYTYYGIVHDTDKQQINLKFDEIPNEGILTIKYRGKIFDESIGLCKAKQNGEWVFYTHFEPICARKCFPCFDEPSFKAVFSIQIVAPKNKIVLSNEEIKKEIAYKGKILHIFNDTPLMSTYIVAFYIGNMKKSEGFTFDNIKIRVFSTKSKFYREDILSNAITCMNTMTKLLGFKYPLKKLDLLFVPTLEASAMENWGLVIFKEEESNDNDDSTWEISLLNKIDLTYTIFHELAHQWFGNIVTMSWWSDIWLNESMATWFGWYVIDKIYPEWKSAEQFYVTETLGAFKLDFLGTTNAVKNNVIEPERITEIFDAVSYAKGCVVITMLINYIGINNFMEGIRKYIYKYQYSNATSRDFINEIANFTNKPIVKMMSEWLCQNNFPVINVDLFGEKSFIITQQVYVLNNKKPNDKIWTIPLTNKLMLDKKTDIFNINNFDSKINKNASGFYVVNYQPIIIEKLLVNNFEELTNLDLAEILTDLFMSLKANKISYDLYLRYNNIITEKLISRKPSGLLMEMIKKGFLYFSTIIKNKTCIEKQKHIITTYVNDTMEKIGIEFDKGDDVDIVNSRIHGFVLACSIGIEKYINYCVDTINKVIHAYHNDMDINKLMDNYLQDTIFRTVLNHSDVSVRDKVFDFLMILFNNNDYMNMVIHNITYTPDLENYIKALNIIFSDRLDNSQKIDIITDAGKNNKLNKYLWIFIKDNWDYISESFKHMQFSMIHIVEAFTLIVDEDGSIREDMKNFFENKNEKRKMEISLSRTIEYIEINTNFNKLFERIY